MDGSPSSEDIRPQTATQASKRRKLVEKTVIKVKVESGDGKQKTEGPPSDSWSWRKYGQKPIKGSPFPRGYYRCSTSKGCCAKKQVERCRTDASIFIITYTSAHDHPSKNSKESHQNQPSPHEQVDQDQEAEQLKQQLNAEDSAKQDHDFHYSQSPFNTSEDIIISHQQGDPFGENLEKTYESQNCLLSDEGPISFCPSDLVTFSNVKSEEHDGFYDELEELPMVSSSFVGVMRSSSFFDERILVHPS